MIVHQVLHGYNDGHRLISGSLPLEVVEPRTMLVMSDLSGPGVKPAPSGYLTGYPLEKAGRYVLAKTWAAPEMPRPGCVWTHSLIIDNADLAKFTSAAPLLQAFQRPEGPTARSGFSTPIPISPQAASLPVADGIRVREIVNALYSVPDQVVIAEATNAAEDERLVTAIWMQQWPRLRRMFGFCTLAGVDRSKKGVSLDLQLATVGDRQIESKFPGAVTPGRAAFNSAFDLLVVDLEAAGSSQLREFLRRAGGDVDGGRRAMLPLCLLYTSMFDAHPLDLPTAVAAFADLDRGGRRQARSVRSLVARHAVQGIDHVDDQVFDFLIDTLENASEPTERADLGDHLSAALWRRSPVRFHDVLQGDGLLSEVAAHSLTQMSEKDIIAGLRLSPDVIASIVERRPDLLLQTEFWRIPEVDDHLVERVPAEDADKLAFALLAAGRKGPASTIVERADPAALILALETLRTDRDTARNWLHVLSRSPNKVAAGLASGHVARLGTVVEIARQLNPDAVPNDYGEDPWLIAMRSGKGPLDRQDEDFLAAFMLARALGQRSRSQAELLRFAYTRVYKALQERRLPGEVEGLVTRRLNWGTWFDWDNCSRLRETVTRRFVDSHLDPETFGRLTDDGSLAIALIDEAARSWKGRRYLGEVRNSLKNASEKGIRVRADYIVSRMK